MLTIFDDPIVNLFDEPLCAKQSSHTTQYVDVNELNALILDKFGMQYNLNLFEHDMTFPKHDATKLKKYFCASCPISYSNKSRYEKHIKRHNTEKLLNESSYFTYSMPNQTYTCDLCGKVESKRRVIEKHIIDAHPDHAKSCAKCGFKFDPVNLEQRMIHKRHHMNFKIHKCETCGMEFMNRYKLNVHKSHHDRHDQGNFGYKCNICNTKFSKRCHLANHMKKHKKHHNNNVIEPSNNVIEIGNKRKAPHDTNQSRKKYTHYCGYCNEYFSSKYSLLHHKAAIHGDPRGKLRKRKKAICEICHKVLSSKDNLNRHRLKIHGISRDAKC